jgi:basic membrane protein A
MKLHYTKATAAGGAALAVVAVLSACSAAPAEQSAGDVSDYLPCVISDSGGFDDNSFNQLSYEGVEKAAASIGSDFKSVVSQTENDYAPNLQSLVDQGCDLIVASGFGLVSAVTDAATANPDTTFAMVDDASIDLPNVKPVVFETSEAAFLGGYAAASFTKTGAVATFGGAQYPSVTLYMDGVAGGVAYYNEQNDTDVELLGWDVDSQSGTFIGNFTDQNAASTITQNLIDQGADVIIPIAGPLYQGAASAVQGTDGRVVMEGVDADLFVTDPNGYQPLFLTSILKGISETVADVVEEAAASGGEFDNSAEVGDLENEGVSIAPFHDFESKVSPDLQSQLDQVKSGIIDGSITVTSPGSLK